MDIESMPLTVTPLMNFPLIQSGDSLSQVIMNSLTSTGIMLMDGDILVLAQKIVSKSEGRLRNLTDVIPSEEAISYSKLTGKDARFVELVLQESLSVLRTRLDTLIVEHRNGFVCANAGIDHSNVQGPYGDEQDWVLLLPEDSDASADQIRREIESLNGTKIGVLIIDSHGRAWRNGIVGSTIGLSGIPALVDLRGTEDLFHFKLRVTQVAAADELAGAASLMMGQASEGTPVVHVRGFPYPLREGKLTELIRPRELDLFR
jgi:coenzyme F420-0:L-glutamate ligase / coenzyme F420-1:gamma-L-glutamate ligase